MPLDPQECYECAKRCIEQAAETTDSDAIASPGHVAFF
jgi:hypothetical protein